MDWNGDRSSRRDSRYEAGGTGPGEKRQPSRPAKDEVYELHRPRLTPYGQGQVITTIEATKSKNKRSRSRESIDGMTRSRGGTFYSMEDLTGPEATYQVQGRHVIEKTVRIQVANNGFNAMYMLQPAPPSPASTCRSRTPSPSPGFGAQSASVTSPAFGTQAPREGPEDEPEVRARDWTERI